MYVHNREQKLTWTKSDRFKGNTENGSRKPLPGDSKGYFYQHSRGEGGGGVMASCVMKQIILSNKRQTDLSDSVEMIVCRYQVTRGKITAGKHCNITKAVLGTFCFCHH